MAETQNNSKEHWYDFLMVVPSWFKGCLVAILGISLVAGLFYWYGIRSSDDVDDIVFIESSEVETVLPPEPGDGYSYFPFDLGMGTFNLILPVETNILETEEDADYVSADLGGNIFLTLQIVLDPLPVGIDCSDYTKERLDDYEHTGSFYKLTHSSGAEACVFNGEAFGSYVFEFNLIHDGYGYEFQTLSVKDNGGPFIPSGILDISYQDNDKSAQFIFSDGFESGDTSVWSN